MIHLSSGSDYSRTVMKRAVQQVGATCAAMAALICGTLGSVAAEAPAFQGHAAEMAMRDPAAEQRHRALFFDTVDIEIGSPGLSCDHVRASKPQAIAGIGYVALLSAEAGRTMLLRAWFAPGEAASADDAKARAQAAFSARLPGAALRLADFRQFHWCR
jgi:hypothetical protein